MGWTLSPELSQQVVYLGTVLPSFYQAEKAIEKVLHIPLGRKIIERHTERVGAERVTIRNSALDKHEERTLMAIAAGPADVKPPLVAVLMADGGRYQNTFLNDSGKSHWREYKAALLMNLDPRIGATPLGVDPAPEVPGFLKQSSFMDKLVREMATKATEKAGETTVPRHPKKRADDEPEEEPTLPRRTKSPALSPEVVSRDVVATLGNSERFGKLLAERAWSQGLFQAERKAFVGDGSAWLWTIWSTHFKAWDFVPILDIIHAVTHVYSAAMAGRANESGWLVYEQWLTWVWNGKVSLVIESLRARAHEVGEPTADDGPTSVRRVVWESLTYLENQQSRMNYPSYRQQGLPITSSHMESAVKELNERIKGSEKFWSGPGGESVLQLKADTLSTSDPLTEFWESRSRTRTGLNTCCRKVATT